MATLMILEPHCSGHRMRYVRWTAREAVARGYSVQLAAFANCFNHPTYLAMQEECRGEVRTIALPEKAGLQTEELLGRGGNALSLIRRELLYYSLFSASFRQLSQSERPDFVFVPWLDYCAHAIALLGSPFGRVPWGGIVMRPAFHFEPMGIPGPRSSLLRPKRELFFRLLRNRTLRVLFTIDELLMRYMRQRDWHPSYKLQFLPDPAELNGTKSRKLAREELGIAEDVTTLLVYGELTSRKGIYPLLCATQEKAFPEDLVILFAGPQDAEVETLLASSQAQALREAGRLRELNRLLTDQEDEYSVFRASDMVWLGYKEHYTMSAILVQAGIMGLPVISCTEGLMGWLTRERELGSTVSIDDTTAVARAVEQLSHDHELAARCGSNGKRAFSAHTPEHFAQVILDNLELERFTEKVTKEIR